MNESPEQFFYISFSNEKIELGGKEFLVHPVCAHK